jgi:ribosomal protein S18 acetylase RimI-like enzyme
VVIRRGASGDAAPLAVLAEQTFRDTFAADNTAADMDAYCATAFGADIQGRHLADREIDTLVVEEDGVLIGYAQLRPGAPPATGDPEIPSEPLPPPSSVPSTAIELWRFYVDRPHHGRGVAAHLMDASVDAARARGARAMWLGVWERNFRAQAFYRKLGFVDVGAQQFVLGTDVQTDRIMVRSLEQPAP